jgi:DNA-binding transcriptional regulator YdaS (Cro superfamily)
MENDEDPFLSRAKSVANGPVGLAAMLNAANPARKLTPQAISQWKRVPADRAIDVEAVTGVSRHDLRPDVFGPSKASAA